MGSVFVLSEVEEEARADLYFFGSMLLPFSIFTTPFVFFTLGPFPSILITRTYSLEVASNGAREGKIDGGGFWERERAKEVR